MEKAFGYFTIVAGTGVVAVGLLETRFAPVSVGLVVVAAVVWLVLGYVLPWQVFMARDGEPIPRAHQRHVVHLVGGFAVGGHRPRRDVLPLVPQFSHLIDILTR